MADPTNDAAAAKASQMWSQAAQSAQTASSALSGSSKVLQRILGDIESASKKFNDVANQLTNARLDKFKKELAEIVKKSGVYTDQLDSMIKDTKSMGQLIEELNKLEAMRLKDGKNGRKFWNELTKTFNLTGKEAAEFAQQLPHLTKALNEHVDVTKKSITKVDLVNKKFEELGKSVQTQIAGFASFGFALHQLKRGFFNMYEEAHRLSNKGLLGAYIKVNEFARRLNLTTEDFEAIIDKNRDLVTAFGGGEQGIHSLGLAIEQAREGVLYLGRDASKAGGMMVGAMKNFGLRIGDKQYKGQLDKMTKQMKVFNLVFGDTPEQYTDLLNQLASEEGYRQRLNGMNKNQISTVQNEIMARAQNLRAIGMNTQQITEYTAKLNELFNAEKNTFSLRQRETIHAQNAIEFMRQLLVSQGSPENMGLAKEIDKDREVWQKYFDAVRSGQADELAKAEQLLKETGALRRFGAARGAIENMPKDARMAAFQASVAGSQSVFAGMKTLGTAAATTDRQQGFDSPARLTEEQMQKRATFLEEQQKKEAERLELVSAVYEKFRSLMSMSLLPLAIGFGSLSLATILLFRQFGGLGVAIEALKARLATIGGGPGTGTTVPGGPGGKGKTSIGGKLLKGVGAAAAGFAGWEIGQAAGNALNEHYGLSDKLSGMFKSDAEKKANEMLKSAPSSGAASAAPKAKEVAVVAPPVPGTSSRAMKGNATINDAISKAAKAHGVDETYMRKMAQIESRGDATAISSTGAMGLYQFTSGTGRQYGLNTTAQKFDPYQNADAAARLAKDNAAALKRAGIEPTPDMLYLAHQQGVGGVIALMNAAKSGTDPSRIMVGRGRTLRQNMDVNGGRGMSPEQFLTNWKKKYSMATPYGGFPETMNAAAPAPQAFSGSVEEKMLPVLERIAMNTEKRDDPRNSAYQVDSPDGLPA